MYPPDYNLPGTMDGIEPQPTSINNVDPTELPDVTWGRVGAGSAGRRVTALTGLPDAAAEKYTNKLIVFLMPNGAREWRRIQVLSFPNPSPTQNRAVMTVDQAISGLVPGQTPFKILSGTNERKLGVEGLVNINTAPLKVLEQLPWVVDPTSGKVDPALNRRMAQQIVQQRASAPFRSLFDLNQVVVANNQTFQNAMGTGPPP